MRYRIFCLVIASLLVWPTTGSFAQTSAGFFSRDEIPAAGLGSVDAYYDPLTGEVLVSVGGNITILAIGDSPSFSDQERVGLRFSFETIDRDALVEDAIGALFFDESPGGIGWVDFLSLIHISEPTRPY